MAHVTEFSCCSNEAPSDGYFEEQRLRCAKTWCFLNIHGAHGELDSLLEISRLGSTRLLETQMMYYIYVRIYIYTHTEYIYVHINRESYNDQTAGSSLLFMWFSRGKV